MDKNLGGIPSLEAMQSKIEELIAILGDFKA
jgi:hypothetical protein